MTVFERRVLNLVPLIAMCVFVLCIRSGDWGFAIVLGPVIAWTLWTGRRSSTQRSRVNR